MLKSASYFDHGSQELHWHADPWPIGGGDHRQGADESGGMASEIAAGCEYRTSYSHGCPELLIGATSSHDAFTFAAVAPTGVADYDQPDEHTITKAFTCSTSYWLWIHCCPSVIVFTCFFITCVVDWTLLFGAVIFVGRIFEY